MSTAKCPIKGCREYLLPGRPFCGRHWNLLSNDQAHEVNGAWSHGAQKGNWLEVRNRAIRTIESSPGATLRLPRRIPLLRGLKWSGHLTVLEITANGHATVAFDARSEEPGREFIYDRMSLSADDLRGWTGRNIETLSEA